MKELVGKIRTELIDRDQMVTRSLIEKINANINPPEPVKEGEVYVRAMYLVSDQVNSYGGRFPAEEHRQLIEMLIDSPVMIGHRKDSLPIARNFHAETVQRDGVNWVKVYFYWLKDSENGEDLKKNIDAGIYKEGSISFIFQFPECSICGSDIRECKHRPFGEYEKEGVTHRAHFNYRQILKVLETSLVYRGSVNNTSITKELVFTKVPEVSEDHAVPKIAPAVRVWEIDRIKQSETLWVLPAYESLPVVISQDKKGVAVYNAAGHEINSPNLNCQIDKWGLPEGTFLAEGRLVGLRGKERQPISEIIKFLKGNKTTVKRTELKILDIVNQAKEFRTSPHLAQMAVSGHLIHAERVTDYHSLSGVIKRLATRIGVEVIDLANERRYHYSRQKSVPLMVSVKRCDQEINHYSGQVPLEGESNHLEVFFDSSINLNNGDNVELLVSSAIQKNDKLLVTHPRLGDYYPSDFNYITALDQKLAKPVNDFLAIYNIDDKNCLLQLSFQNQMICYRVNRWSTKLLNRGRRFLLESCADLNHNGRRPFMSVPIADSRINQNSLILRTNGALTGVYLIRSVSINGHHKSMLYKISDNCQGEIK